MTILLCSARGFACLACEKTYLVTSLETIAWAIVSKAKLRYKRQPNVLILFDCHESTVSFCFYTWICWVWTVRWISIGRISCRFSAYNSWGSLDFYPQPSPFLDKWCEDVNNVNLNIFCPHLFRFTFPKLYVLSSIIQNESHYSHMYSPTLHDPILPHVQSLREYALACLAT